MNRCDSWFMEIRNQRKFEPRPKLGSREEFLSLKLVNDVVCHHWRHCFKYLLPGRQHFPKPGVEFYIWLNLLWFLDLPEKNIHLSDSLSHARFKCHVPLRLCTAVHRCAVAWLCPAGIHVLTNCHAWSKIVNAGTRRVGKIIHCILFSKILKKDLLPLPDDVLILGIKGHFYIPGGRQEATPNPMVFLGVI